MPTGTLNVTIIAASSLKDKDFFTKMDPYCFFTVGSHRQRTVAHIGGGKNPYWNQSFSFSIHEGVFSANVTAYDMDIITDDYIGRADINLQPVFQYGVIDNWYPLLSRHGHNHGQVHIKMQFYPGPAPMQYQQPVYAPPPVQPMYAPPPPMYVAPAPVPPPVYYTPPPAPVVYAQPAPAVVYAAPPVSEVVVFETGFGHHHHHHHRHW
eukprot:Colp12_sorted_trinity150504_noHs@7421